MALLLPVTASADDARLGVVVREGSHDALVVTRLRGQLADLDGVELAVDTTAAVEATLDGQLAAADRVARAHDARVVVWFVARERKLVVAIATPLDHRVFVREIGPADDSTMAEAAAIAVRGAVKSIALGGTIGVEVKPEPARDAEAPPRAVPIDVPGVTVASAASARTATTIDASLGWQVALDGGATPGAQALVQRTRVARGDWGASLALALGVSQQWRASSDVVLDVSRSSAVLVGERRLGGGVTIGVGAGGVVYHRSTSTAPAGLAATPSNSTVGFAGAFELAWRHALAGGIGVVACAGIDVVAGAPEAAVARDGVVEAVDAIRAVQPRASLALELGSW